jgi:ribonuclease HI
LGPIVHVHADESCLGVQFQDRDSPGGAGALVEVWRNRAWQRRDLWISEPATTNNRMALKGAVVALDRLRGAQRVIFVSDSQYLVRGMREWAVGWARRGWSRRTGTLENAELWRDLARAAARHAIDWRWVRGHAGHPRNEYANHLATTAAKEQSDSGGFIPSGFETWLQQEREKRGRYLDYHEFSPPPPEPFQPAPKIPL